MKGLVELFGEVRIIQIVKMNDGNHNVYLNDGLYDGTTFEEFVENCGNKIYKSLEDYRKGKFEKITK